MLATVGIILAILIFIVPFLHERDSLRFKPRKLALNMRDPGFMHGEKVSFASRPNDERPTFWIHNPRWYDLPSHIRYAIACVQDRERGDLTVSRMGARHYETVDVRYYAVARRKNGTKGLAPRKQASMARRWKRASR